MDKTDPWVVLVVTPLNERAQKLKNRSEIIFMDSTSSCDVSMASVTVLLTATKGGAVPIGVLIHKQQTAMAYEKGFKMLMDNFPLCFNGLSVINYLLCIPNNIIHFINIYSNMYLFNYTK